MFQSAVDHLSLQFWRELNLALPGRTIKVVLKIIYTKRDFLLKISHLIERNTAARHITGHCHKPGKFLQDEAFHLRVNYKTEMFNFRFRSRLMVKAQTLSVSRDDNSQQ